ncbi:LytR/AlgR family response regulator transcription factor [Anaeromicropila populeti]|uniref:Stage 0 sporulation protein A homolog n=1 Tax=Anaeromicropila populeti TaxID=37658 RepID=A0A1I6LGU1_9FIRM|nr:LytTR family transcriptional regulator DNA-binding domain-containing protein [Anaeromicropila populeti]SFS02642.1 two component transcriptional regulator, LytTR family [Anaeromicropila populeti]
MNSSILNNFDKKVFHILLCDDDIINLEINQKYVELYSKKQKREVKIHLFSKIDNKLYEYIKKNTPDIALLDIDMPDGNGIAIAKELQKYKADIPIIFITGHAEYKTIACDILAIGYLIKPVIPENFELLYRRAIAQVESEISEEYNKFLILTVHKKVIRIRSCTILCIEKLQKNLIFKTEKGIFETRDSLVSIEGQLTTGFLRISQSVIVNRNEILSVDRDTVYLSTGDEFPIGRTYLTKVKEAYRKIPK